MDLAPTEDSERVPNVVAAALGVHEARDRDLTDTPAEALSGREALLVLDNCEHLRIGCARLAADLLRGCPDLRVLATSRERLGIEGEHVFVAPPLSLPDAAELGDPSAAARSDAVRLFLERAATVSLGFAPLDEDLIRVAAIARRLDGLPLAIELAAARMRVLSVAEIHARLDDRFRLLVVGTETRVERHQTLSATIQWSYDLLGESERRLLRALSVFAGEWTLSAAHTVSGGAGDDFETLDRLGRMVDKSLVTVAKPAGGASRYRLLESVRHFALEHLATAGEADGARERHLDFFLALAEAAAPELAGPKLGSWVAVVVGAPLAHRDLAENVSPCDMSPVS